VEQVGPDPTAQGQTRRPTCTPEPLAQKDYASVDAWGGSLVAESDFRGAACSVWKRVRSAVHLLADGPTRD